MCGKLAREEAHEVIARAVFQVQDVGAHERGAMVGHRLDRGFELRPAGS